MNFASDNRGPAHPKIVEALSEANSGYADSYGGDESNQALSQERAESVQQYMINAMRIPSYRLIATGYGETNPVANNETEAGRARNRRIDIVIKPDFDSTSQARN